LRRVEVEALVDLVVPADLDVGEPAERGTGSAKLTTPA